MTQQVYLDYAAATPVDQRVLAAMQPFFAEQFYNPSATYLAGLDSRKALEAARGTVAHWLGARSSEIIFTAGGTEANNLAIHGVLRRLDDMSAGWSK
jgi:cysteine desulfurase